MRDRIDALRRAITGYEAPQCGTCHGSKGYTRTRWDDDGTRRDSWHACGDCRGTGVR